MKSSIAKLSDDERFVAAKLAQADLYFYSRYMFMQRRGFRWIQNWHHKRICDALTDVFNGKITRLIINVPPRYSKTELAVVNFPTWALGHVPDAEFIYTSYSGAIASQFAGEARDLISHEAYGEIFPDVTLASDSKAKAAWKTTNGGAFYSVGTGGSTTGMGAGKFRSSFGGAIIIDDAHKADEARSDVIREGVIEWYQSTLQSRTNSPVTPIIVIGQRLHERDLPGWLLEGGTGEKWTHIVIPAISDDGEALWPEKHTIEKLREMQTAMPYTFSGQYQQKPSSPEGNIFKPDQIEIIDAVPAGARWLTGWDFAATVPKVGSDPDYTVGLKLGMLPNGRFVIGDMTRMRGAPDKVQEALVNTSKRHGVACKVSIPQDPGQAGKSQVLAFTKLLRGYRVSSSPESGDKILRAEPFAAQVNVGNVSMVRADWNDVIINEMRMFPNASHDDTVDASSRAFNELNAQPRGIIITKDHLRAVAKR